MKINKSVVFHIFQKEILHIKRGHLLPMLIIPPILQMIVFGYVVTTEVKHISMHVVDRSVSKYSRLLIDKFSNTEYFDIISVSRDEKDIERKLTKGQVKCALNIPEDFQSNIKKGKETKVQFITDGSDSNVGSIAVSYGSIIISNFSQEVFAKKFREIQVLVGRIPNIDIEERIWFNPELKSTNTMIPGVIGMILMIVTVIITSLALVKEKEYGNIEQLAVTPIKPFELLLGKILPYIVIGLMDVIFITIVGLVIFYIGFKGNFLLLLLLSLLAIFVNLSAGIFISTISQTQQQAMVSAILFLFSNVVLSGFIFPINNMPEILQYVTYLMPLRYFLVILRGIFLKGLTFFELIPATGALLIYLLLAFTFAVSKFRKIE